jgi:hypothetical protein
LVEVARVAAVGKVGNERRAITLERQKQFALMSTMVEEPLSVGGSFSAG